FCVFPSLFDLFFCGSLSSVKRGALSRAPGAAAISTDSCATLRGASAAAFSSASRIKLEALRELSRCFRCLMLQTRACQKRSRGAFYVIFNGRRRRAWSRDQRY